MLSVVIQAGGESRRMGQDKALLPFLGQPLIERVIHRIRPLAGEILVTTNRIEQYDFLDLPLYEDLLPGIGALGGLHTALSAALYPAVAVVACDMPFVSASLLEYSLRLLEETPADAVIPRSSSGTEPFHAVYRKETCLPAVEKAIQAGQRRLISWLPEVRLREVSVEEIQRFDAEELAFWNLNTPEEFQAAEQRARQMEQE